MWRRAGARYVTGTRTLLLLLQLLPAVSDGTASALRATSFYLSLLGLSVPLLRKGCASSPPHLNTRARGT